MNTLLVINLKPELEEDMVDYLLSKETVEGFTSYHVRGHGRNAEMSLAEQVTGRRKRLQFEIILDDAAVVDVIAGLADNVGKGIHYWQLAISNVGSA